MTAIKRIDDLWRDLKARLLADAQLSAILGGDDRVYVPSDNPIDDVEREGRLNEPWGRVRLMARSTLWPQIDVPGDWQNVAFLAAVQFNDFRASGYDVNVSVDAAHERVYRQLDNYAPALERITIVVPLWRYGSPPPSPVYDASRRLWLSNAEYRTQVVEREQFES